MAQLERAAKRGSWTERALLRSLIAEVRDELHTLDVAVCLPSDPSP
jgi:hypothetical protein